ncbi:MAG TPA: L-threonylcarbamoyladenylate synthase [Candidatus Saccharimonadales bacterium]|nr:L-threonylcarbamoyladenylate synthase [Candidatus Saccharimonadales bacterium]
MQAYSLVDPKLVLALKTGAVGALPTDTIYGLVCSASNQQAASRLYGLSGRSMPGTIIAANTQQLVELGLRARYLKAVEQYWPGPLSVVIPCGYELSYLHLGKNSLAVRVPADSAIVKLLAQTGPLLTTSAARSGESPARSVAEARTYFAEAVDFYVDGGSMTGRLPSTVIRVVDDAIEILRKGAVKIDESGKISP